MTTPSEIRSVAYADALEQLRAIEPGNECERCGGWGKYAYPDTSTWRHGIGGQSFTTDVCDGCWGSGDKHRPWPSWRART